MVPVGRGVQHEYQNMMRNFTCCVGTGMESHALHGDGIYYESGDRLWVNLYAPSTAEWPVAGLHLRMDTSFPEGETARLAFTLDEPREFTLALRRPHWTGDGFTITVNGATLSSTVAGNAANREPQPRRYYDWPYAASSFVDVKRTWRTGDVVELTLPKTLRLEPLPDDPHRVSIMWGPLVLAGDLGPERRRGREGEDEGAPPKVPVFVTDAAAVSSWVKPISDEPIRFRSVGVGREPDANARPQDVDLVPFYRLQRRTYSTYWDVFSSEDWAQQQAQYAAEAERQRLLEAATVAYLEPGETVFEREFNYQGAADAVAARLEGRPGRRGRSWFSYDLPVEPDHPMTLILTYNSGDRRGTPALFDILVDDRLVQSQEIRLSDPPRFYDVEYPLAADIVAGKQMITVRFQATEGSQVATLFGVRVIRADAKR